MSKIKNKSKTQLSINLPNQNSLHLAAREISRELTQEEIESKEIVRLMKLGMVVRIAEAV